MDRRYNVGGHVKNDGIAETGHAPWQNVGLIFILGGYIIH